MPNIELRAPRRTVRRERDRFIPIALTILVAFATGFILVEHYDRRERAAAAQRQLVDDEIERERIADVQRRREALLRRAQDHRRQAAPAENRLTTASGRVYEAPPAGSSTDDGDEPSVTERYARASRIMESTMAAPGPAAPEQTDGSGGNYPLQVAEASCRAAAREGTIAYRHCRGEQWQRLREGCIQRRQRLTLTTGDAYQALRLEAETWCEAERRYHVVG